MMAKLYHFLTAAFVLPATLLLAQGVPSCGAPPSSMPPSETCEEACVFCDFNTMMGSTSGFQGNTPPPGFCGTVQNDQWVAFLATAATESFTLTPSNCAQGNGLELAFYETCTSPPLSCAPGQAGGGSAPRTVTASNLTPGKHYYLLIDGYNGDICDFTLVSNAPPGIQPPPFPPSIGPISGPAILCPGSTNAYYQIPAVAGAGLYTWSSSTPGVRFNGNLGISTFCAPEGRKVQVSIPPGITGSVQLCVEASNSCVNNGPTICRTIQAQPIPVTKLPTRTVCYEDREPWMQLGDLIYRDTFISHLGCDSVVQKRLIVKPPLMTNIGSKYICEGSYLLVCEDTLRETGQIQKTCTSYQGCDSMVTGHLIVLQPKFQVSSGGKNTLTCTRKEVVITLVPIFPTATITWRKLPQNTVLGTGKTFTIKTPGLYTATSSVSLGGISCNYIQKFDIKQVLTQPEPIKISKTGSLSAGDPSVQLLAASATPGLLYQWIGPQGFISVLQNPVVQLPGLYTVTATHPSSGCSVSATVLVD